MKRKGKSLTDAMTNAHATIGATEVELRPGMPAKYTQDAACKLVVQDFEAGRDWLDTQAWVKQWEETRILYQSPRQGGISTAATQTRANVSRFTVAKQVNALTPTMKSGIFYETPPFVIRPKPSQSQETAFAKQTLYGAMCEGMKLEDECELALDSMATFGTGIMQAGFEKKTRLVKVWKPKAGAPSVTMPLEGERKVPTVESDEFDTSHEKQTVYRPYLEFCELGTVVVNPAWRVPNRLHDRGGWVVKQSYVTLKDLDEMRDDDAYDIPDAEELKDYLFTHQQDAGEPTEVIDIQQPNYSTDVAEGPNEVTSEDIEQRPIEMLERWDYYTVRTVIRFDSKVLNIRAKDKEEHGMQIDGEPIMPFFSGNFWNQPGTPWGLGVGRLAGSDQRTEQGSLNAALDILSSNVNPMYLRDAGANVPTQDIRKRLDAILTVTTRGNQKVTDAFAVLPQFPTDPNVWRVIQDAQQSSQAATGADEAFTQGSLPQRGGSSAARTATGAGGIIAANAGKIQGPVGHFVKGILLPFLSLLDHMVKEWMPPSEIRKALGKEMTDAYLLDLGDFLNDIPNFDVLAGAHLAAKKAMAQALPLMLNLFDNPEIVKQLMQTGWTIDVKELLEMFYEVSEWKNTRQVVRPMTEAEKQHQAQMQQAPQMGKVQGALALEQAKQQGSKELLDQRQTGDLAKDMLLKSQERADGFVERRVDEQALLQSPNLQ